VQKRTWNTDYGIRTTEYVTWIPTTLFGTPENCDFGGKSQKIAIPAENCEFRRKSEKALKVSKSCDFEIVAMDAIGAGWCGTEVKSEGKKLVLPAKTPKSTEIPRFDDQIRVDRRL
jgi:hypothetical protein